jgi:polyhydroxyalkanoate synthesis regulator phasin
MSIAAGGKSATKKTGVIFRVNNVYFNSGYSQTTLSFSQTKVTKVSNRGGIDCHASLNPYSYNTYNLGNSTYYWQYVYVNNLMNKTASTEWSDKRFKKEMRKMEDKYDKFYDDLSPTEYRYQDGKRLHFGLIANDIKESLDRHKIDTNDFAPFVEFHLHDEFGHETEETRYGIRYTELIALNIDQIQKLKKRVEELENKLRRLERK